MADSSTENEKTRQLGWRINEKIAAEIEAKSLDEGRSPGKQLEWIYKRWKQLEAMAQQLQARRTRLGQAEVSASESAAANPAEPEETKGKKTPHSASGGL